MRQRFCLSSLLLGVSLWLAASGAQAEPLAPHQPYLQASLGLRVSKVPDEV